MPWGLPLLECGPHQCTPHWRVFETPQSLKPASRAPRRGEAASPAASPPGNRRAAVALLFRAGRDLPVLVEEMDELVRQGLWEDLVHAHRVADGRARRVALG